MKLDNPHLPDLSVDHFHHLGFASDSTNLVNLFHDVKVRTLYFWARFNIITMDQLRPSIKGDIPVNSPLNELKIRLSYLQVFFGQYSSWSIGDRA